MGPRDGMDLLRKRFKPSEGNLLVDYKTVMDNALTTHIFSIVTDAFKNIEFDNPPSVSLDGVRPGIGSFSRPKMVGIYESIGEKFTDLLLDVSLLKSAFLALPDICGYRRLAERGFHTTPGVAAALRSHPDPFSNIINSYLDMGYATKIEDAGSQAFKASEEDTIIQIISPKDAIVSEALQILTSSFDHPFSCVQMVDGDQFSSMFYVTRVTDPQCPQRSFHVEIGYDSQPTAAASVAPPIVVTQSYVNSLLTDCPDAVYVDKIGMLIPSSISSSTSRNDKNKFKLTALNNQTLELTLAAAPVVNPLIGLSNQLQHLISSNISLESKLHDPEDGIEFIARTESESTVCLDVNFFQKDKTTKVQNYDLDIKSCPDLWGLACAQANVEFCGRELTETPTADELPLFSGTSVINMFDSSAHYQNVVNKGNGQYVISTRSPLNYLYSCATIAQDFGLWRLQNDPFRTIAANPGILKNRMVHSTPKNIGDQSYSLLTVNPSIAYSVTLGFQRTYSIIDVETVCRVVTTRFVTSTGGVVKKEHRDRSKAPSKIKLPLLIDITRHANLASNNNYFMLGSQVARDAIGDTVNREYQTLRLMGYMFTFSDVKKHVKVLKTLDTIVRPNQTPNYQENTKISWLNLAFAVPLVRILTFYALNKNTSDAFDNMLTGYLRLLKKLKVSKDAVLIPHVAMTEEQIKRFSTDIMDDDAVSHNMSPRHLVVILEMLLNHDWDSIGDFVDTSTFDKTVASSLAIEAEGTHKHRRAWTFIESLTTLQQMLSVYRSSDGHKCFVDILMLSRPFWELMNGDCTVDQATYASTSTSGAVKTGSQFVHPLDGGNELTTSSSEEQEVDALLSYYGVFTDDSGNLLDRTKLSNDKIKGTSGTSSNTIRGSKVRKIYVNRDDFSIMSDDSNILTESGAYYFFARLAEKSTSGCKQTSASMQNIILRYVKDFLSNPQWITLLNTIMHNGRLVSEANVGFDDPRKSGWTPRQSYRITNVVNDFDVLCAVSTHVYRDLIKLLRLPKGMSILLDYAMASEDNKKQIKTMLRTEEVTK